jgi:hypothetical protein
MLHAELHNLSGREVVMAYDGRCHLGYLVVLTIQATEVAARAGDRQTRRARMEMIQRFLLYRVDSQRTGLAIHFADKHTLLIAPSPADARITVGYLAAVGTEQTLHYPTLKLLIIPALHHKIILNSEYNGFVNVEFGIAPAVPTETSLVA